MTEQSTTAGLVIRPATPDDHNFIKSSWVNSWRTSAFAAGVEIDADGNLACSAARVSDGHHIRPSRDGRPVTRPLSVGMNDVTYHYEQRQVIDHLLRSCTIDTMCVSADPSTIAGWLCTDVQDGVPVVHYCYVQKDFRGLGVATALLANRGIGPETRCFYTHAPAPAFNGMGVTRGHWKQAWLRRSNWVHDPYCVIFSVAHAIAMEMVKGKEHGTEQE